MLLLFRLSLFRVCSFWLSLFLNVCVPVILALVIIIPVDLVSVIIVSAIFVSVMCVLVISVSVMCVPVIVVSVLCVRWLLFRLCVPVICVSAICFWLSLFRLCVSGYLCFGKCRSMFSKKYRIWPEIDLESTILGETRWKWSPIAWLSLLDRFWIGFLGRKINFSPKYGKNQFTGTLIYHLCQGFGNWQFAYSL